MVRTLIELGPEAMTRHVVEALCQVIERDERPSFYKAPLALLSELDGTHVLKRLTHISSQTHHTRRKRGAIQAHVALIHERMNVYGGELSLSVHDTRLGALSEHEQ